MGKADLHIHTTASDGNLSPDEIIDLAQKHDLQIISITDHDTIRGYLTARKRAGSTDIELLPGVEITCAFNGRESHLLGYCFDPEDDDFLRLLSQHKKARLSRIGWITEQLRNQGLEINREEVKAEAAGGNVGRPHVASMLIKKGYVQTAQEAFIRYLGDQALGPIESNYISYEDAIKAIKDAGGAAVLAHPGVLYSDEELEKWVDVGLDGIEVIHPSHNYSAQKKFNAFAEHNDLIVTGGSDFHGGNKHYLKHFGTVTISVNNVEKIKRLSRQRKGISV